MLRMQHQVVSFAPPTPFATTQQQQHDSCTDLKRQRQQHIIQVTNKSSLMLFKRQKAETIDVVEKEKESDGFLTNLKINPPYALAYIAFTAFAVYQSSIEPLGASNAIIEKFIADPINPGINSLYCVVFNYLGLFFFPMGCLLMPGSKGQSLPAPPFILASMAAGYGSIGLYVSTRKSMDEIQVEDSSSSEPGFVTKNILENKIVNWIVVAVALSTLVSTGAVSDVMTDSQQLLSGFGDVLQSSALGSVSTIDFLILTLTGASLIPEDLKRRSFVDSSKANAIAASTALLPLVGLTLYCALRPPLADEE